MISQEKINLAADVLDQLAEGRSPARADLIVAALALDTLVRTSPNQPREILDAAAGLELAVADRLDLDPVGRTRARVLAQAVRAVQRLPAP